MRAPGPTLTTDRLILRPPDAEDFPAWRAMAADDEVMRFLGGVQKPTTAWRGLVSTAGSWALHGFAMFSVLHRETGRWLGRVGPWQPFGWPGTEVGWGLARDAWGQGYGVESAAAAMTWAFDELGWKEVVHLIEPQNARSIALAKRLGSAWLRADLCPGATADTPCDVYGQTREQWRARR